MDWDSQPGWLDVFSVPTENMSTNMPTEITCRKAQSDFLQFWTILDRFLSIFGRFGYLTCHFRTRTREHKFSRAEARNYYAGRSRNQTNIRGLNLNGSQHKDHSHHIQYPETSGSSLQDLVTTTIRLLINPQPVYRREVQAI